LFAIRLFIVYTRTQRAAYSFYCSGGMLQDTTPTSVELRTDFANHINEVALFNVVSNTLETLHCLNSRISSAN